MIKNLAAEYAEDFTAFVIDHLKEAGQYESVFNDYTRRYGRAYANDENFKAKIEEEIVAEHCFEALTNKEQWEKFAGEHKSIAEKIKDFIKEFVAMINNAFDKYFVHDNAYIRNSVAVQAANNIAKSVIAQSFVNITPETFESYKKELRSHRLIPSLDDVAELTAMFGTFGAAYRQYGKKLNMRAQGTENAVHIDEIWDDLCAAVIRDVLYIFQSPTRPRLPNTSFLQSSSGPLFAAAYG